MDRILIIITIFLFLIYLLIKNRNNLTYSVMGKILVAVFIFSTCFSRFGLPIYSIDVPQQFGSFGYVIRFELYMLLIPFLLWFIGKYRNWQMPKISKYVIIGYVAYFCLIILNPNNSSIASSLVAIFYITVYSIFIYLLICCFSIKTIIEGIFIGFAACAILHFILAILFPVLWIEPATKLFNSDSSIREISRAGAVGTLSHPNGLGVYSSYYFIFFISCIVTNYRKAESIILVTLSFIVIFLSGSRSSLMAITFGVLLIIILFTLRKHRIFSPKIIFKGLLPIISVTVIILFFTPLGSLFIGSNMDEMMVARMMHYYCAWEVFNSHPIIGVGLNTHLSYMIANIDIDFDLIFSNMFWEAEEFMLANPIHNIWLILLVELGLVGIIPIIIYLIRFFYLFKIRIKASISKYYNIAIITTLGIIGCLLVQGNSDWNPLTSTSLNISILFLMLSANTSLSKENEEGDLHDEIKL